MLLVVFLSAFRTCKYAICQAAECGYLLWMNPTKDILFELKQADPLIDIQIVHKAEQWICCNPDIVLVWQLSCPSPPHQLPAFLPLILTFLLALGLEELLDIG